jgi:uncharacterized membrane protein
MGILLFVIGLIISVIGGLWLMLEAFREHILWGLGYIFIPLVGLVFVFMHWDKAKKPFLWLVAGWILIFLGGVLRQSRRERIGGSVPAAVERVRG